MNSSERHLARPLYESLPWLYTLAGLGALIGSYFAASPRVSAALGLPGFAALLGGIVIWLRRRDYRRMRLQYARPDALAERGPEPRGD